jgi:hypothetical protein
MMLYMAIASSGGNSTMIPLVSKKFLKKLKKIAVYLNEKLTSGAFKDTNFSTIDGVIGALFVNVNVQVCLQLT